MGNSNYRTGWAEYNLSYKCATLRTRVGLSDGSKSGSTRILRSSLDGNTKHEILASLGTAEPVTIDVAQGFRIRFEYFVPDRAPNGSGVWGTPKVLCTSAPGRKMT